VLAQQHYRSFAERLGPFPARVEMLSRFLTPREQDEVVRGLKSGEVDVVIGTHRLVQKDVDFKDLGIVIIDEEHRFGVAHKERLRELRTEVDVLTLTATPIPRTLHMAMSGIRDISTIETPPEERLPIRTYLAERSDDLVKEALQRELDRGGQVFFLHNRVKSIHLAAAGLRDLVPEARVLVGHGQMPEDELAEIMERFADGEGDVLVCTTIIESGLDIPDVNTLVVDHADRFGLAQLYQLRGRVGRGSQQARAYLLHRRGGVLNEAAQQRLATIFDGITRHSPEGVAFKKRAEEAGWKQAVAERDTGTYDWTRNRPIEGEE
jgi:transcription-repair coupling factor (superfamily II helicase)